MRGEGNETALGEFRGEVVIRRLVPFDDVRGDPPSSMLTDDHWSFFSRFEVPGQEQDAPRENIWKHVEDHFVAGPFFAVVNFADPRFRGKQRDPGDPRYLMYPFAAAVFAIIGTVIALKSGARSVLRVMWFGLVFLAALVALYLFYFFTEIAFILPATFILFAAAGYGIVAANRAMLVARARVRKSPRDTRIIAGVIALDLMLTGSLLVETAGRITTTPPESKMVPTLLAIRSRLQPDAIVISNISLQFLELYVAKPKTELVGLNAFDPGGKFTDYHLARLYAKKAAGWDGPAPPVLFAGPRMDDAEAKTLSDAIRSGRPAYLLMTAPERQDYADLLKDELAQLNTSFTVDSIARSDLIDLYRLTPR